MLTHLRIIIETGTFNKRAGGKVAGTIKPWLGGGVCKKNLIRQITADC
jgi:hypothetical protein